MKFFTFRKDALKYKKYWQKLRFWAGKGYWLFGKRPAEVTMYDSIDLSQIPPGAKAVAGYVNGRWPTYPRLAKAFPHAVTLSIDVFGNAVADCIDVERGDATNATAVAWVKKRRKAGFKPVVYTSVSNAPTLLSALAAAGVKRSQVRLWTAHYTGSPHRCTSKCWPGLKGRADATQWRNGTPGRNVDVSLCAPNFFQEEL